MKNILCVLFVVAFLLGSVFSAFAWEKQIIVTPDDGGNAAIIVHCADKDTGEFSGQIPFINKRNVRFSQSIVDEAWYTASEKNCQATRFVVFLLH